MPRKNSGLARRRGDIEDLLRAIASGSELPTGAMCRELASSLPSVEPTNLHRSWTRWLRCSTDGSVPDVTALAAVVSSAVAKGWVHSRTLPNGARSLLSWLGEGEKKVVDEVTRMATSTTERKVGSFVEALFKSRSVKNADIEQLAPRLMRAFAIAVAVNVDDRYRDKGGTAAIFRAIAASAQYGLADFVKEQEAWEARTLAEHGDAMATEPANLVNRSARLTKMRRRSSS